MEKEQIIEELKGLEAEFDFEKFFSGNSKYSAALRVVTPSQEITVPTLSHAEAAKKIMEVLYDDFDGTFDFEESFPDDLNKKNAVAILMMNGPFEIIYVPETINSYQFNKLISFKEDTEQLCRSTGRNIELHTNVFNGSDRELYKVIEQIESRVDDLYEFPKENSIHHLSKTI